MSRFLTQGGNALTNTLLSARSSRTKVRQNTTVRTSLPLVGGSSFLCCRRKISKRAIVIAISAVVFVFIPARGSPPGRKKCGTVPRRFGSSVAFVVATIILQEQLFLRLEESARTRPVPMGPFFAHTVTPRRLVLPPVTPQDTTIGWGRQAV